jgi:hypothetical protein
MLSYPWVLFHAFGTRYDLPVPLWLFVTGGALVVFASFLFVLPRPVAVEGGVAYLPDRPPVFPRISISPSVIGGLILAILIFCGLEGSQEIPENILPTMFWIVIWIAIPLSCGILGDWTRTINPFAALARAADRPGLQRTILGGPPLPWPSWLGWWPATLLFFLTACGELIYNQTATKPAVTAVALLAYAFFNLVVGLMFGSEIWIERGEMFSVLYNTWGRLGFFRFGAPGTRGFGGGLKARFEPVVSRITFVLLLLMSVSFDGLLATPAWKHARDQLPGSIAPGTLSYELLTTAAFIILVLLAWLLFGGFAWAVKKAGRLEGSLLDVLGGLIPSLVPIAFGYLFAHNAEYLAINGQLLLPLLGNPPGGDSNTFISLLSSLGIPYPFHYPFNDSYVINKNLLPSSVVWYTQVALIIFVHIAAVILAHDYLTRAARTKQLARDSEWPWIVIMVIYTMSSLWLLAQPLVKGG